MEAVIPLVLLWFIGSIETSAAVVLFSMYYYNSLSLQYSQGKIGLGQALVQLWRLTESTEIDRSTRLRFDV